MLLWRDDTLLLQANQDTFKEEPLAGDVHVLRRTAGKPMQALRQEAQRTDRLLSRQSLWPFLFVAGNSFPYPTLVQLSHFTFPLQNLLWSLAEYLRRLVLWVTLPFRAILSLFTKCAHGRNLQFNNVQFLNSLEYKARM